MSDWIGAPGIDRKHTEDLLHALLRHPENSKDLVEELNAYVSDLKAGELSESDARYIQALAKRLGVASRSGTAADDAGSDPDIPQSEVPDPEVPHHLAGGHVR